MVDYLWRTEALDFMQDGGEARRTEKIAGRTFVPRNNNADPASPARKG